MRRGRAAPGAAATTGTNPRPETNEDPTMVGPIPKRPATRPAVRAPSRPATFPRLKIRPSAAGVSPSSRVANRMYSVKKAELKKLDVPVQPAIERRSRLPKTTPRPSRISAHIEARAEEAGGSPCGGGGPTTAPGGRKEDATNAGA